MSLVFFNDENAGRRGVILMKAAKMRCPITEQVFEAESCGNFNESGKREMSYNRSKYLRLNRVIGVL